MITFFLCRQGDYNVLYSDGELKMAGDSGYVDIETAGSMCEVLRLPFEWYEVPDEVYDELGEFPRYLDDLPLDGMEKREWQGGGGVYHYND